MQITEKVGPWINESIRAHGQGEDIVWEPVLRAAQDGEPIYTCFFWLPGALAGTVALGSFVVGNPLAVTQQEVDETVQGFLAAMREARSRDLEAQQAAAVAPPAPEPVPSQPLPRGMTASGLYLPGR